MTLSEKSHRIHMAILSLLFRIALITIGVIVGMLAFMIFMMILWVFMFFGGLLLSLLLQYVTTG